MLSDSLYYNTSDTASASSPPVLVYMIPGNPGLIEYYRAFLSTLSELLEQQCGDTRFVICGNSLAGFQVNGQTTTHQDQSLLQHAPPYSLEEQVIYVRDQVRVVASQHAITSPMPSRKKLPVILMGHSVGAYILLEIIARQQAAQKTDTTTSPHETYEIIAGICLFPTIVHIAKSPTGRKVGLFTQIPGFAIAVHLLAKLLCLLIPDSLLFRLVKLITKMPDASAKATQAFLQSSHGVRQSLHMGKHELEQITDDRWGEKVWNAGSLSAAEMNRPRLYFFWGEQDHWVDNRTRDALIAARATQSGGRLGSLGDLDASKPKMEIDHHRLPHAFCIRHSQSVADKVASYIHEMMELRRPRATR